MMACDTLSDLSHVVAQPTKLAASAARRPSIQSLMKWRPAFVQCQFGGGLQNLGNSCFMNATLQCLTYLAPLTQLLMTGFHSSHCTAKGFCLLCECEALLPRLATGQGETLFPVSVFENLSHVSELLHPGQQEDAHEFLQNALVQMEKTIDDQNANNADGMHNSNLIRDIFLGRTQSWTECQGCGNVTSRQEPFLCLSVDVGFTFFDTLSNLCQREIMEGKDAYDCDNCRSKQKATRHTLISHLPPVLAVHIKRFRTLIRGNGLVETQKNTNHVSFPLEFEVSAEHVSKDCLSRCHDWLYGLRGMIVHRGDELSGGHYYAIVRGFDGEWYRMDDNYVTHVEVAEVLNQDVYILFYAREEVDDDEDSYSDTSVSVSDESEDEKWEGLEDWMMLF